ncbi:MAG: hypothetical protein N3D14_04355 [Aquificaceae bacterium]|nr:hypothetical protein [Aquificaceae bacterium]
MDKPMLDTSKMEEILWHRRMNLLYQYKRLLEIKDKIKELERMLEKELEMDVQTLYKLAEGNENSLYGNAHNKEPLKYKESLLYRIKTIREMKRELELVEREVFQVDAEIDQLNEKLKEYSKRIKGTP